MLHIATALGTLRPLGLPIPALRLAVAARTGSRSLTTVTAPLRLTVGGTSWHLLRRLTVTTSGLAVTTGRLPIAARLLTVGGTGRRGAAVGGGIIGGWLLATIAIAAGLLAISTAGLRGLPIARRPTVRAPRLRLARLLVTTGWTVVTTRIALLRPLIAASVLLWTFVITSVVLLWALITHGLLRLAIAAGIVLP